MLDPNTIAIVKSTAPILQQHGELLTKHFYKRMFSHNPEVIPLFNQSNQSGGTQQKALAGAIAGYAAHIDNLEVLTDTVELIAQKHAALQIKAEHYPIVGENLLASIKEVLGDGATDEIIDAWGKAYWFLADILKGREAQIYTENAEMPGGWDGFRSFIIDRKVIESDIITSFYLKPQDGSSLPKFQAGQYITLRLDTPDGSTTMRTYSLSDKPGLDYLRISVKRELGYESGSPRGFASNKLHDDYAVGDCLEVGPPCGGFVLNLDADHERPLVLLAGGVGITPIMSMLLTALEETPNRNISLIYCSVNEKAQAFKKGLDELAVRHANFTLHHRYSEQPAAGQVSAQNASIGFITPDLIDEVAPTRQADYYFCGPKPFMAGVYQILNVWGIPDHQLHYEFFGPQEELETVAGVKAA